MASHISQMEQSISATWIIMSSLSEMQIFMNIREEIFISFQSGKDFHKIERNAFWPVKRKYKIPKCFRHTSRQSYICCLWLTVAKLLPKSLKKDFFWNWQSTLMYILYPKNIFYLPWSPRNGKLIPQGVKFYKELPSLIELLFIFEKLFSKNQIGSKNQVQAKQKIKFIQFTQPNWTLFFLIFTYLRCRSH